KTVRIRFHQTLVLARQDLAAHAHHVVAMMVVEVPGECLPAHQKGGVRPFVLTAGLRECQANGGERLEAVLLVRLAGHNKSNGNGKAIFRHLHLLIGVQMVMAGCESMVRAVRFTQTCVFKRYHSLCERGGIRWGKHSELIWKKHDRSSLQPPRRPTRSRS